jgi:hypothetical protein
MATHRVGGEIDATCTRCRMELAHTILALVGSKVARVRCNTCGSDHVYRGTQSSSRSAATRTRAASAEKTPKTVIAFDAQLAALDVSKAEDYRPDHTYAVDQVVRHPTFGLGIVRAVRQDKMDVAFKATERTLVQGRSASTARPSFSPPHRPEDVPEASDEPDQA